MHLNWPDKDPDEVLDYQIDWNPALAGDTIQTSTWVVPTGITRNSDSKTTTTTTIWLSSGVEGQRYSLVNRITTVGGRVLDQTVRLRIRTK